MTHPQNPEITTMLRGIAHSLAKDAPRGWQRASIGVQGIGGGGGLTSWGVRYSLADGTSELGSTSSAPDLPKGLVELFGTTDDKPAAMVMAHADGRFEAVTIRAVVHQSLGEGRSNYLYVLRPDVVPPNVGDLQADPVDPTQAGDPAEAVRLLRAYLRKRAEIFGWEAESVEDLGAPRTAEEIEQLEQQLRVRLPDDLRALYTAANGEGRVDSPLFDRHSWLDLEQVVSLNNGERWWANTSWKHHSLGSERAGNPGNGVRSAADRPGWISFAAGADGDFLAVDMDPAALGRPGQVIRVGRYQDDAPVHIADSVTEMLQLLLLALEQGDYEYDSDFDELLLRTGFPRRNSPLSPGGNSDADAPLNHAHATCDAELEPLAGNPTLAAVTVQSTAPVSLAPLRDCTRLYALDLSQAEVRDLEVVAALPGLLWLSMRPQQWRELIEGTGRPPGLAAAVLTETPSPSTLAEWVASLGADDDDFRYYTGRLPDAE